MDKAYSRIIWQNQPSTATALGATNLNKIDMALNEVDNRVVAHETSKADLSVVNNTVQSISFNESTGIMTITKVNGTSSQIDTKLEKLAVNFSYNSATQQLVITLDDGTVQYIDLSSLIAQYEFEDSDTVSFTITNGVITAIVPDGSITPEKLQPDYLADVMVQASTATAQASLSKRYAVGGVESGDGTDNAKYYKEQAEAAAATAQEIAGFDPATKLDKTGDSKDNTVTFTEAGALANIASTESHATLFGKIKKFFSFIGTTALTTTAQTITTAINELVIAIGTKLTKGEEYCPNLLINGDFQVWQRGTSQTNNGYGSADRWSSEHVGDTKVTSQQAFTAGQTEVPGNPLFFLRTVVTSIAGAANRARLIYSIEDVTKFAGKTVTLTFWAKADSAKNIAVEFAQVFGSGGSATVYSIGAQKLALTTAWKKFTITVAIPSVSGKTIGTSNCLGINIWFDAGSDYNSRTASLGQQSGTYDIAQVKLEVNDHATPFMPRSFGEELALCQRYYEKSYNYTTPPGTASAFADAIMANIKTTSFYASILFKVDKRIVPTVTFYSANNGATGVGSEYAAGFGSFVANRTVTGLFAGSKIYNFSCSGCTVGNEFIMQWTADAEL